MERVVVINDRSEARGGASALAILSVRLLRQRGVPVTYITGDGGSADFADGTEVVAVDGAALLQRSAISASIIGLYNRAAYRALSSWIAENDTPGTVYHLHGWSKILTPAILHALHRVRERTVLHAHDYFLVCPNGGFMNYRRNQTCRLDPASAACIATNCDKRSYPEKLWWVARQGVRLAVFDLRTAPSDIVLIHPDMAGYFERCGVAPDRLHPVRNPVEPLRAEPVQPAANRSAFFIGRLEMEKGITDLAEAARRALVPLEIIGDGPVRSELEKRYPDVTFHGWQQREAIGALIASARVVVLPTRYPEPFGLVAVEALSCGVPVLASDTALLSREIVEKGMGERFRANDVDDCAASLRALAADDERVARMGAKALAHGPGLANSPDTWCDALLARYEAALSRDRRPSLTPSPSIA